MTLRDLRATIDLMIEKHALQVKNEGTEITLSATAFIEKLSGKEKVKIKTPEQQRAEEDELVFAHVGGPGDGRGPL